MNNQWYVSSYYSNVHYNEQSSQQDGSTRNPQQDGTQQQDDSTQNTQQDDSSSQQDESASSQQDGSSSRQVIQPNTRRDLSSWVTILMGDNIDKNIKPRYQRQDDKLFFFMEVLACESRVL